MRATDSRHAAQVLGVDVDALDMEEALGHVAVFLQGSRKGYVCVASVHGIMEAQRNAQLLEVYSNSAMTRARLVVANIRHIEEMEGLSPHGMLRTMTTPVYLLHGQGDNIIPAAETLWMASELPRAALQEVLVSPVLSHLDLDGAKPDVWDQWRLVHFFALVMHAAERK